VLLASGTLSILLGLFLLGNGWLGAARVRSSGHQAEQSESTAVKAAYETYLAAWKDKGYAALNRLLSNDYQAVNFQGIVSTKAHEIATAREDRTYETLSGDVMSVAVFGNSAVASGLVEARWKDERGSVQKLTLRFLAMLQKQHGHWRLVATESTTFNSAAH
jgi:ketosteroid isomerase-like protein